MKNLTLLIFSFFLISSSPNSDIDKRIDSIMSNMTIEQKIGQMAQINLTVLLMVLINGVLLNLYK